MLSCGDSSEQMPPISPVWAGRWIPGSSSVIGSECGDSLIFPISSLEIAEGDGELFIEANSFEYLCTINGDTEFSCPPGVVYTLDEPGLDAHISFTSSLNAELVDGKLFGERQVTADCAGAGCGMAEESYLSIFPCSYEHSFSSAVRSAPPSASGYAISALFNRTGSTSSDPAGPCARAAVTGAAASTGGSGGGSGYCCKHCTQQACGDSCIGWDKTCSAAPGCACQG